MEQKRLDELKGLVGMVEKLDSMESEGRLEMRAVQELIEVSIVPDGVRSGC